MDILDPDLWNDDGTPKRPSKQYMKNLQEAQDLEAVDPETPERREQEKQDAYLSYQRAQREFKENTPATLGDIVHFWDDENDCCRAAMVVGNSVMTHNVELHVFVPNEVAQFWFAAHDENKEPASWHWPEGQS